LIYTWIVYIILLLLIGLIKSLISDYQVIAVYLIGFVSVVFFLFLGKYSKSIRGILLVAYIIRFFAMFWDIFARDIFILPHSGGDTEGFLQSAIRINEDKSLLSSDIYGGVYSKILGLIFILSIPERMIGQFFNVLLGVTILIIIYRILVLLDINNRTISRVMLMFALFPHAIIFSGILLRENLISFFLIYSLYFFIKWCKKPNPEYIIFSFLFLLSASSLHSGVIGIAIGYVFIYMFYSHKTSKLQFQPKSIALFIIFLVISSFLYIKYYEIIFGKFGDMKNVDDLIHLANIRSGGSAYLESLQINSLWELIAYSPIRIVYFLISPLPFDWRGINDVIIFLLDSSFYFLLLLFITKKYKKHYLNNPIIIGITISLVAVIFIFGIGVSNAGTAIRHRNKIFSILLILVSMFMNDKKRRE